MAATMRVDLVSPEARLASVEASAVTVPGAAGDFTAMPGHAPFLATLRPGIVTVTSAGKTLEFFVSAGFAEVGAEGVSILAEVAIERTALTGEMVAGLVAEAEATAAALPPGEQQALATLRVNDLRSVRAG